MSSRILVVTAQGEVRYLGSESEAVRVLTIQPTGARGEAGATGAGVAAGGSANDILKKTSSTDYATAWETPTSAATANTVVRRDASGGAAFDDLTAATVVASGAISTSGSSGFITTEGSGAIIATSGINARIGTEGTNANIYTLGSDATIFTNGERADIFASNSSASVKSYNFAALDATAGAALRNSAGTAVLTWGASGQNLTVTAGTAVTYNATSYTFGTGAAAAHRTALGLTSLATASSGSGVITALAINIGSSGSVVVNGGALGQPTSGTLTSCSGLPISTGVSGLGTGVATLLTGTPSGTGGLVGTTSPTITTPTMTRSGNGTILTASEGTRSITFGAQSYGTEMVLTASTVGQGAYLTANGMLESWVNVIANTNTTNLRVMRFGNKTNRFEIQRLNDASNSILGTPFSLANNAPDYAFYMLTSGTIGCGTSTPSEKSLLDLTSTTKGFLPPRMTTVQRDAITSVPAGLMIYNTTTNKLNFYNGSAWEAVTSA